jgi:predicted ATPase
LKVLVTSRAPLRIAAERAYAVPPLTLPDGEVKRDTEQLVRDSEAARLFIARAREARPGLEVSESYEAVSTICRRLEGMPLALELAAARASHLTITDLAGRLDHQLGLLTRGRPDMPLRHQSVKAAIDTSHELLEPAHRDMFTRLGVFVGGFTLEAAEAICGHEVDFLDGLAALIDNSLVRHDDVRGHGRYTMLEVIREYALERLGAGTDAATIHERHTDYYLALAERQAPALRPGGVDPAAIATTAAEQGNARAVLRRLYTLGDGERLLRMAAAMGNFWIRQFHRDDAVYWIDRGLLLNPDADPRLRGWALEARGAARLGTGEHARALHDMERALALGRSCDDLSLQFHALCGLGTLENLRNRSDPAEQYALQSLAVARQLGDRGQVGGVMANLADAAMMRGDWETARRYAVEGVEMQLDSVDRGGLAGARHNLGLALLHQAAIPDAATEAASALALSVEAEDIEPTWSALLLVSAVASASGMSERAACMLGGVDALRTRLGLQTYQTVERRVFDRTRHDLKRVLGDERFQRAWDEGAALSVQSLIELGSELAAACATPVAQSG